MHWRQLLSGTRRDSTPGSYWETWKWVYLDDLYLAVACCHRRLNSNSFHVHYTEFPTVKTHPVRQVDGFWTDLSDTDHNGTVLDQTGVRKRSNAAMFCLWQFVSITVPGDMKQDNAMKRFWWIYRGIQFMKLYLDSIMKITDWKIGWIF